MRRFLAVLSIALLAFSGIAVGQENGKPENDPTCDNPQQTGEECAGDNGAPGCEGIREAEQHTPGEADEGLDLVNNILGEGRNGEC